MGCDCDVRFPEPSKKFTVGVIYPLLPKEGQRA